MNAHSNYSSLLAPPLPHTHAPCRLHSLDTVSSAAADGFHSLALEHNGAVESHPSAGAGAGAAASATLGEWCCIC